MSTVSGVSNASVKAPVLIIQSAKVRITRHVRVFTGSGSVSNLLRKDRTVRGDDS
jgi:hypothetical protein